MKTSSQVMHPFNWADTAVSAVFLMIGVFFFSFSFSIDESLSGGAVGPRMVPQVISTLLIIFSTVVVGKNIVLYAVNKKREKQALSAEPLDQGAASKTSQSWAEKLLPLQILSISLLYVLMFQWFGYLLATLICVVPIYISFGNRTAVSVLLLPLVVIGVFYSLFFGVMGLFDLPGSVLDTTQWFRW